MRVSFVWFSLSLLWLRIGSGKSFSPFTNRMRATRAAAIASSCRLTRSSSKRAKSTLAAIDFRDEDESFTLRGDGVEDETISSFSGSVGQKRRKRNPKPAVVTPPPQPRAKSRQAVSTKRGPVTRRLKTIISTESSIKPSPDEPLDSEDQVVEMPRDEEFLDLNVSPAELRPSTTLTTGQCFHWRATVDQSADQNSASAWGSCNATEWVGVLPIPAADNSNTLHSVVAIRETPTTTLYRALSLPANVTQERVGCVLKDYFQVDSSPSLKQLYEDWSAACPRLARIAHCIPGVRVVQQDPWECLVSFLCSSNNNIPRITKMLNSIRQTYGAPLATVSLPARNEEDRGELVTFFSFPTLQILRMRATDDDLRTKCGMGYRAKYLIKTISILQELGGEEFLKKLRSNSDPCAVQQELCQFHGVGPKVADCVALFSLNQVDAIPVDVHVWNVARRDYDKDDSLKMAKSLTPTIYNQVGGLFRAKFPEKAGWAHSLLFVAELPSFRPLLPDDLVAEMDQFRESEKEKKKKKDADKKGKGKKKA